MPIFLIRHGETLGNASGTIQLPDSPLSPRGLAQAERLARRLQSERISAILSSDFARAATTAEHLRIATGAPVAYDPLLQERNFGDIRGKTRAELGFDMFAPDYAPPNGETWDVFGGRDPRARLPIARRQTLRPSGRPGSPRALGEHWAHRHRSSVAVARAGAQLHRPSRRSRHPSGRRLRTRLTPGALTPRARRRNLCLCAPPRIH